MMANAGEASAQAPHFQAGSDGADHPVHQVLALLSGQGQLTASALARARAAGGARIDRTLLDLGLIPEEAMAAAYAAALGLPLRSAAMLAAMVTAAPDETLNPAFLRANRVLPLPGPDGMPEVVLADPLDPRLRRALVFALGREPRWAIATGREIEALLARILPAETAAMGEDAPDLLEGDAERLRDLANEGPVVRQVGDLVQKALSLRATDIHVEPMADRLVIRYRVDGLLRETETLPRRDAAGLVSRLKVMAGLDIGERRLPQDGRIRQTYEGRDIDFRLATVPTVHGEDVVMRVLDQAGGGGTRLDGLGLPAAVERALAAELDRPHGIVLVTGPTGSGKTTTLYAGLRGMDAASRKILTVEDPVEYMLDGVNQTQVKPAIGLSFAHVLRSFLRQDPDVILVGEIRDGETAAIAVQAALTGHLVLSTLHTNSAAGALPRLMDMGVDPYLLSATINGVLAQRLVRTLCPHCKGTRELTPDNAVSLGLPTATRTIARAEGCAACGGTGYRGRRALAEWLPVDETMRALIREGADADRLERAMAERGFPTLARAGAELVLAGLTTPEEVMRVAKAG
ncbi:GspE/PulE family protein [Niveispirillum sp. KHB5.9]|uniref:GspE/PulE family protein n=1 Tax=Niveispirillum sp. KHB5.9 TaxID=3400269 RepID=UPI003A86F153